MTELSDAFINYFSEAFSSSDRIWSQCIGIVAALLSLLTFIYTDRKRILITKLITDILWTFSFLLGGAWSGTLTNTVNAAREGIFYFKKPSWKRLYFIPVIFCIFYAASAIFTWNGFISLVPMTAASISVIGLWATKPLHTKLLCLPSLALWLWYSLATYNIMSALSNVISVISICIGLIRECKNPSKAK